MGSPMTNAQILDPNNPIGEQEFNRLIGLFGNFGPDIGSDAISKKESRRKILLKHAPTGENHSNDAFIDECATILKGRWTRTQRSRASS
jgi:hypothetical protein